MWIADPGTGHTGNVLQGSRMEKGCLYGCPSLRCKTAQTLCPNPAQGPQLQGQVPDKAPQLKLIPIAIKREITFITRL